MTGELSARQELKKEETSLQMKEKVIQIFKSFFGRNSNYVVYAYLKNGTTGNILGNC